MTTIELMDIIHRKEILERTIRFCKDVTDESMDKLLEQIFKLHASDRDNYIVLHLTTGGGITTQSLSYFGIMKTYKPKLITITSGKCMSAGVPMLLVSEPELRFTTPLTQFLVHPTRTKLNDRFTAQELEDEVLQTRGIEKMVVQIIKDNTSLPEKNIWKMKANDAPMNAQEAVKYGLVKSII